MEPSSKFPSIVFFGNERLATGVTTQAPVLSALIEAGYPIEAVIVNNQQARSRKERILEVEEIANQHNIPILKPNTKTELIEAVQMLTSPVAVLAAYGRIIPKVVIDHFAYGIVNIHPSKLPLYRGSTPIESVILDGSTSTTVSLMALDVKMDAGGVYAQKDVLINLRTSKQELANDLSSLGAEMIIETLPFILGGKAATQPQNEEAATYTKQIEKSDGQLDFTKSAATLEREVRAFAGWPGSLLTINDKPAIVTAAAVLDESGNPGTFFIHDQQLAVYCGEQALLISHLKPAGKNEMSSRDYLRGNTL
jgi:methionyl-tRNA formyltransferase